MYIDLHTHSIASDDSKASVEQFAQWTTVLKKKGFNIDGFVLTEHRQFNIDIDYSELSNKYNIL
jgi:histidinol phosphatase-like PHP family hydrolase